MEEERKLKSKLDCLFPQTASDSSLWVTVPLPLSLSLWLPLSRRRKEKRGRGREREEEASFHGDGWWKRTKQVLLGCTPLLSFSLFFLKSTHVLFLCHSPKHLSVPFSNFSPVGYSTSFPKHPFILFQAQPSSARSFSHCYLCLFHTNITQCSPTCVDTRITHRLVGHLISNPYTATTPVSLGSGVWWLNWETNIFPIWYLCVLQPILTDLISW